MKMLQKLVEANDLVGGTSAEREKEQNVLANFKSKYLRILES